MADKSVRGRFVWHDLVTSDAAAAQTFYTKVIGWKTEAWQQDSSYTMFAAASGPLGGVVVDQSAHSHWIAYIGTDNLQGTIDQATSSGASLVKAVTPAGSGAYALLKDPQGVLFGVYSGDAASKKDSEPKRGEFSWHELATSDPQAALDFYTKLFDWTLMASHDMGPMGTYHIFGRNERSLGGVYAAQGGMPPSWLGYVRVKDVNQTVKKVKSGGGKILNGPMEVPGGDWIVQFTDPQGGAVAAHTLVADLQGAKQAAAPDPSAQSVTATEVEEVSTPIEPQTTDSTAKQPRTSRKSAAKSSAKAKSTKAKAKKKAKAAKRPATKKASRKSGAKKRGAKRAAAKSARGARKAAKRSTGRKSAKKSAQKKVVRKATKKSRSPRKAK